MVRTLPVGSVRVRSIGSRQFSHFYTSSTHPVPLKGNVNLRIKFPRFFGCAVSSRQFACFFGHLTAQRIAETLPPMFGDRHKTSQYLELASGQIKGGITHGVTGQTKVVTDKRYEHLVVSKQSSSDA